MPAAETLSPHKANVSTLLLAVRMLVNCTVSSSRYPAKDVKPVSSDHIIYIHVIPLYDT